MKEIIGGPGTVSGLLLRIGQCVFAAASISIMTSAIGFSSYTSFCYLIASMGLQLLWSFGLACLDIYALRRKKDLQNPVLVSLFVVGDWAKLKRGLKICCPSTDIAKLLLFILFRSMVTAMLSLAAACSSAGVVVLYARDMNFCKIHPDLPCSRYEISILLAFITWLQVSISSHVMFWILASV
ncbi:CASP-like protein 5B2 isoform X1 [Populus nigra]|uniref:CASP-like protein 5B2 isoform X1 n=1 Tax=Populus nigra TaxID=3691 RepID=UPI002B27A56E|nr:CASP-like protein 5B2 isoform X1 [Populus nigra]XP_061964659.1 CASP-like protein 5B2 isoform X1 [Populus nigra]